MKHKVFFFLFACFTLASCIDDDFVDSCVDITDDIAVPEDFKNGYSLSLKVTLDRMGGTRAATIPELEEVESYINPEKFRVLFFDHEDKLLFESKSRWVKMLNSGAVNSEWLVSVPLFTYGNDVYEDAENKEWPWEIIKESLTTNSFKIAILANRHDYDWYPGFSNTGLGDVSGWIDNTGPHWTPDDFREKTLFDLHHCQYDAIYHGKSAANNGSSDFYDFIAKDYYKDKDGNSLTNGYDADYSKYYPQMGATSSWADWDFEQSCDWITEGIYDDNQKKWQQKPVSVGNTNNNEKGWVTINSSTSNKIITYTRRPVRRFRHPSQDHPIPMYGVQKFNKIENWSKGTPFNLSKFYAADDNDNQSEYVYKNISLLRSVVKLELLIPKDYTKDDDGKPEVVALAYPNIYARCEPMDVWTPTDELWDAQHPKGYDLLRNYKCQDTEALLNYGPVATTGSGKFAYQQKLSWFYGAWLEDRTGTSEGQKGSNPWWEFEPFGKENVVKATAETPYPRIFNSYIQRNNIMICDDNVMFEDGNYWHYIVYTGERNILDPSALGNMGNRNSGQPTVMYWIFEKGDKLYGLPITDYDNMENIVYNRSTSPQNREYLMPPDDEYDSNPDDKDKENHTKFMVIGGLKNMNGDGSGDNLKDGYSQDIMTESDPNNRPWPLIRNHVYRLALTYEGAMVLSRVYDFAGNGFCPETTKAMADDDDWTNARGLTSESLSQVTTTRATPSFGGSLNGDAMLEYGSPVTIDGKAYTPIISRAGTQNKLILPPSRVARNMTLYSYVNEANEIAVFSASVTLTENKSVESKKSLTVTDDIALLVGGKMTGYNGDTKDANLIGKSGSNYMFCIPATDSYFKVELNEALAVGDVISAKTYSRTDTELGLWLSTATSRPSSCITALTISSVSTPAYEDYKSYTVKSGDGLEGKKTFYIYRSVGKSVYFNEFKITRVSSAPSSIESYWNEVAGKNYSITQTGISKYKGQGTDKYVFDFAEKKDEVTFTNTGKDVCFVAFLDVENADGQPEYWEYNKNPDGSLKANGANIKELQGLDIQSNGVIRIYDKETSKSRVCLTETGTIGFPKMDNGYIITITGKSTDQAATTCFITPEQDYITSDEADAGNFFGTTEKTFKWTVNTGDLKFVDVKFNFSAPSGIDIYKITIDSPAGARTTRATDNGFGFKVKSEDLHSNSIKFDK